MVLADWYRIRYHITVARENQMPDSGKQELQRLRNEHATALAENKRLQALVEQLTKQIGESLKANEELRQLLSDLQAKLDTLIVQQKKRNRRDYGKKTERYNPRPAVPDSKKDGTPKPRRRKNKDRLAQIENLPTEIVSHAVSDNERFCQDCKVDKVLIGEEVTYQLERIVNTMKRLQNVQEVLACPKCKSKVVVAPKPQPPFPKCLAAPGLLSHVIVSKYADFTPLYRLERIYAREGAPIPRSTLCDWVLAASLTLQPLRDLLQTRVLKSKVVRTDDTEVKILDRKTKKNIRRGKMTAYLGDDNNPYSIFDFSPNQSFDRNKKMFENFRGFVQADAAPGFDAIFEDGKCVEVGCNAHARRKFFECLHIYPDKAKDVLQIYKDIYDVEEEAREKHKTPDQLLLLRQEKSKPLFAILKDKLLEMQPSQLPKSPLSGAINYVLKHWTALTRHLADPDLNIDNNLTEQTIKDFVLARKNFLFVGSEEGGRAAATCLSILASAKRNKVEPWAYLKDIFTRINDLRTSQLEQLLPDVWLKSQFSKP